jgi:catechol 2,3-dioxygenase-like lactoylglutathione lyase family enzyme
VIGGSLVQARDPTVVRLANSWLIMNPGGGPTPDKPAISLAPPDDPARATSFLNLRVADIAAAHKTWTAKGATFVTPPIPKQGEIRCYIRDPDGYLIEVGQAT